MELFLDDDKVVELVTEAIFLELESMSNSGHGTARACIEFCHMLASQPEVQDRILELVHRQVKEGGDNYAA